tara:strand:+ start:54 stop:872 length:819 start_codon:yes stop_codon:yes gene_type:complete
MFSANIIFLNKALFREAFLKSKNLKIRTILEDDISRYGSDSIIDDDEVYYEGNAIKIPDSYDGTPESVYLEPNLSNESLAVIIDGIQQPEQKFAENEPPNEVLDSHFRDSDPDGELVKYNYKEKRWIYPEGWDLAYYPGGKKGRRGKILGKKPNIDALRLWVRYTKLASKSQHDLEEEYERKILGRYKDMDSEKEVSKVYWDEDKMDTLVRNIAYLVGKKIWYVGRRSSRETDEEWDEHTKDMRPAEGTYDNNDTFSSMNIYDADYEYESYK